MSGKILTAPDHEQRGWPSGIKYIIGNEGAERFSFYGMKAILYVYLTALIQVTGLAEEASESAATAKVHLFIAGVYAFPLLGALIADKLIGKYHTIIWLSIVYCAGHALMAIFDGNLEGTYWGLALISIGAGGIKPCVSAHVGDQFGRSNWHLINKVFQAFYFIINFGSFFATLLVPVLYDQHGAFVAFGIPGVLMAIATFVFWMGRHDFVHVPASPGGKLGFLDTVVGFFLFTPIVMLMFAPEVGLTSIPLRLLISLAGVSCGFTIFQYRQRIKEDDGFLAVLSYSIKSIFIKGHEVGSSVEKKDLDAPIAKHWFFGAAAKKYGADAAEGPLAVFRIVSVFFLVSFFWMLFDQHSSTWVEQAKQMDREVDLLLFSMTLLPSQVTSLNPIMVMALIPLLMFWILPGLEKRGIKITPLRKMSVGMFIAGIAYVSVALIQARIESNGVGSVSIGWQLLPYLLMTLSEVLVSVTGLEFAYTQAPKRMKSIVMGFWLIFVALGNWLVALFSHAFEGWNLSTSFWAFAGMMFGAALIFTLRATFYTYKEYTQ